MFEVEAKVELLSPGALRDRLRAANAIPSEAVLEADLFFSHPSRNLAKSNEAFRLRLVNGRHFLTYKGPKSGEGVKVRQEEEIEVLSDPTAMLAALGFTVAASLSKKREAWKLGHAHVTLDEIDGLGNFAEVEVISEDEAAATHEVETILKALGLEGATRFDQSYLEMALASGAAAAQSIE